MPAGNTNRGTSNADTRRASANTATGRNQSGTDQTVSSRSTSRTGSAGTRQTQSTTRGDDQPTTGRQNQASAGRQSSQTTGRQDQSTTQQSATDRELPVQSGRETGGRGRGIVRGGYQSPVYGGMSNPFTMMRRMMDDMDRLFSNVGFGGSLIPSLANQDLWGGSAGRSPSPSLQALWAPQVDIFQRGDNLIVRADLPGLKKEDVDIEVNDGVLTIRGEREDKSENEQEGFYRSERSYGSFFRAIPLPEGASAENAQATFNDGVLEVTIPTPKAQAKGKKVEIK